MKLRHMQFWSTDTELRFNINKSKRMKQLLESGWDENSVIDYNFDSNGFRNDTDEHPKDSIMVLGCSFAQGVGLRKEQTFGALLSEKLGIPHVNYAMQGTGPLAAFYIADKWVKEVKPKYICYLRSITTRLDVYDPECEYLSFSYDPHYITKRLYKKIALFNSAKYARPFDHWWMMGDDFRSKFNECVELAITKIANDNNAKIAILDCCGDHESSNEYEESLLRKSRIRARDLMHEGPPKHEYWALKFLQELELDR